MKRLFLTLIILCSLIAAFSQPGPSVTISGKGRNATLLWGGSDSYYARDGRILSILQQHGRITISEINTRTNVLKTVIEEEFDFD